MLAVVIWNIYWNNIPDNRVFSHDVTTAILVSQNKEMAATLVSQTKPLGIGLYFYANTFFCFSKPICPVVTLMKMLYTSANVLGLLVACENLSIE